MENFEAEEDFGGVELDSGGEEGGGRALEIGEEGIAWEVFEEEEKMRFGLENVMEGAEEGRGVVRATGYKDIFFEFDVVVHLLEFEFFFVDDFHCEEGGGRGRGGGGRRGKGC